MTESSKWSDMSTQFQ